MGSASAEVTVLLKKWRSGDEHAADNLMPLVYAELRRIAKRFMARERVNHISP